MSRQLKSRCGGGGTRCGRGLKRTWLAKKKSLSAASFISQVVSISSVFTFEWLRINTLRSYSPSSLRSCAATCKWVSFFLYHCQQWNQRPPHLIVYETLKDWTLPQHGAQKQPYHLSQWELYQLQSSSWTLILFWWESSQGVALSVKVLALPYRCNSNHLCKWHLSLQRSEH